MQSILRLRPHGWFYAAVFLAPYIVASATPAQEITVQSDSGTGAKLSATEIARLPHQTVSVDVHGNPSTFDGVPVTILLEKAGIKLGDSLRGKRLSDCLLVEAADGYRVVIALPELDSGFTDRVIILADRANGHPLDSKEGPFRIIIPGEKRMARWVRQVRSLTVVHVQ